MLGNTVRIDQGQMKIKQKEEQEKGKAVIQGIVSRGHTVEIEANQEKVREEEKIETEANTIKDSKETISREMGAETGMEKTKEALPEIRAPL